MKIDAFNFTIYDVETVHKSLIAELESSDVLEIDMASVEKVDMAALQLLVSAKLSCKEENKTFTLSNLCDEVQSSIMMSGLDAELGV